jgi:DNA-binding transcriptional ArsR family regulator
LPRTFTAVTALILAVALITTGISVYKQTGSDDSPSQTVSSTTTGTTTVTTTTTKTSTTRTSTVTTSTTTATATKTSTVTSTAAVEPTQPPALFKIIPSVVLDNVEAFAAASWIGFAGALIWRGYVRSVWSRSRFDYDVFNLLVRMRGGQTRISLLESLGEPKNKLQLAKELRMDWKAVDRHIEILLKHHLITESDTIGNVKYYSLTPNGREILGLLDELLKAEKEREVKP